MITNGFTYFATLVLIAGILVGAQKLTRWKFFEYVPPVVLLYLIGMLGCTFKLWARIRSAPLSPRTLPPVVASSAALWTRHRGRVRARTAVIPSWMSPTVRYPACQVARDKARLMT